MEIPCTVQTKHISFENPFAIQSEGDVDAKLPRPSHEETKREAMNEAPTVHPDEQTSKSETQATGERVENSRPNITASYRLRKPFRLVESAHWLPKGWLTELRVGKAGSSAGNRDKFYYDPVNGRQFRSKKEVFEFIETGKRRKRRPKTTAEEEEAEDETNGLSGTTSAFYSGTSNIVGISLDAGKRYKGRPKLNPQREIGDETKDLSGTTSEFCSSTSKIGGFFLETEKQSERRPKMNSDREFGNETKGLSRTTSEFYSGAFNIDGISPYDASCPFLVSSPSCSMPSSIIAGPDLLVDSNHTASLLSNTFPMLPIVHEFLPTSTPISSFHDSVSSQSMVRIVHQFIPTSTPISSFHVSAASQSIVPIIQLLGANNRVQITQIPFQLVSMI